LWLLFLLIGLVPEVFYISLRTLGGVVTQHALVNSPHVVQLALAGYLGYFVYLRCIDASIDRETAAGKGVQLAVAGLVAFLPTLPETWNSHDLQGLLLDLILLGPLYMSVILIKLLAWCYLFLVLLRYYFLDGERVLQRMLNLFPSTRETH